jgi:hypothetical protein
VELWAIGQIFVDIYSRVCIIISCGAALREVNIAELCNGSTTDSDSVCLGSSPSSAAKIMGAPFGVPMIFTYRLGT